MAERREYQTEQALRTALETRLHEMARRQSADIQRLRRRVAFDRFLARLFSADTQDRCAWFLKGGYAMELRMHQARSTKDIDLTMVVTSQEAGTGRGTDHVRDLLMEACSVKVPDGFVFLVGESVLDLDGPPEGGRRYPVHATMGGRTFARFRVDVGIGDALIDVPDRVAGEGWFDFAGLPRPEFRMISTEQQFAEKIHAYSLPRQERDNSRAKDLVDLVLLQAADMEPTRLRRSIRKTFERRNTHPIPAALPEPPRSWEPRFQVLARECGSDLDLKRAFEQLTLYFASLELERD